MLNCHNLGIRQFTGAAGFDHDRGAGFLLAPAEQFAFGHDKMDAGFIDTANGSDGAGQFTF
mgnify:CR=1 FL=1